MQEQYLDFESGKLSRTEFKDVIENKLNIPLTDKFNKIVNSCDKSFTSIVRVSYMNNKINSLNYR